MKWIGLTGGIATGKSTVAEILKQQGHPVINADEFAHQALRLGSPIIAEVIKAFGQDISDGSGGIDRKKLGEKVFRDDQKRQLLESLIHPFVKQQTLEQRKKLEKQGCSIAFYDVPLLFEANLQSQFDKSVVVWSSPELQLQRLMKRNNLSEVEARARINSQIPIEDKKKMADFLIENNSSVADLERAVEKLLKQL